MWLAPGAPQARLHLGGPRVDLVGARADGARASIRGLSAELDNHQIEETDCVTMLT